MAKVWPWIFGIAIGLFLGILLAYGASNRESYWVARGPMARRVVIVQPASQEVQVWRVHHVYER